LCVYKHKRSKFLSEWQFLFLSVNWDTWLNNWFIEDFIWALKAAAAAQIFYMLSPDVWLLLLIWLLVVLDFLFCPLLSFLGGWWTVHRRGFRHFLFRPAVCENAIFWPPNLQIAASAAFHLFGSDGESKAFLKAPPPPLVFVVLLMMLAWLI